MAEAEDRWTPAPDLYPQLREDVEGEVPSAEGWKMSTGWEQDLFDVKAAVLARAEGRSIPTGTGGDSYGFTFDQVTALDPVAQSPSTLAGRCPS